MPKFTTNKSNPFVNALFTKINESYAQMMGGTPSLMSYANGLHSTFQGGPNAYWNPLALNDIDKIVIKTNTDGMLSLGSQSFSFLYNTVLGAITYVISTEDFQTIQTDQQNADASIIAVIQAWELSFGTITPDQLKTAVPPSKIGYIQSQVVKLWNGDINQASTSVNDLKVAYQTYQVQANVSYQILERSNRANQELQAAKTNTAKPSATNGGLQIGDNTYQIAYKVPTQAKINADLQATNHTITLSVDVSSFSENTVNGTIDGKVGFTLPILDLLNVDVQGQASYDWSSKLSNSSTMTIEIKWSGVTIIGIEPAVLDNNNQGWFDELILQEALENAGKGKTVTGFQIQGHEFDNFFGPGGHFSRLKTVMVSQVPTMAVTFTQGDVTAFSRDFKENTSVSIDLFGFIPLGSVSQSYQVSSVQEDTQEGSITINFGPSPLQSAVGLFDYTAYLLAGVPIYPPMDDKLSVQEKVARNVAGLMGAVYQCLRANHANTYCSSYMVRSHIEGANWVRECMRAHGLTAADVQVFQSGVIPMNAIWWP